MGLRPSLLLRLLRLPVRDGHRRGERLARAVLNGAAGARERYVSFLGSGGSDYPLELLRAAGVDLESPAPYDATFLAVNRKLDALESLL